MVKMLTRLDGKLFLEMDQSILDQLRISEETPLDMRAVNGGFVVEPQTETREVRFRRALEETNQQFGNALRRLAE